MSARSSVSAAPRRTTGSGVSSGPIRTCVGCRRREPAAALLRIVAAAGTLVPDPRRRLPGRGAWLHPDTGCLDAAERKRAFPRSLRTNGMLESSGVRDHLRRMTDTVAARESPPGTDPHPAGRRQNPTEREQVDTT